MNTGCKTFQSGRNKQTGIGIFIKGKGLAFNKVIQHCETVVSPNIIQRKGEGIQ